MKRHDVHRHRPAPAADERKLLARNLRDGRFENVTAQAGSVFQLFEVSRGAAFGDIDNDGDIDIVITNIHAPARLLINTIGNRKHWVGLRLVGVNGRDMLAARVEIVRQERRRASERQPRGQRERCEA